MAGIKEHYQESCVPQLMKEFGYTSIMQVPKLTKIVLNMGLGEAVQNPKIIDGATNELTLIAGQRAVVTKARKSIVLKTENIIRAKKIYPSILNDFMIIFKCINIYYL